ncbi:UNVERIFIED_ORG: hypothetical protein M2438_000114 [Methylobacterium sp. SuP10 SLI 274]|nr:hypothetical protein [Methylobacterium sp. SuP10 SLI 274]
MDDLSRRALLETVDQAREGRRPLERSQHGLVSGYDLRAERRMGPQQLSLSVDQALRIGLAEAVRDRAAVLAITIQQPRIETEAAAGGQQPYQQIRVLADPEGLVVAERAQGLTPEERLAIAEGATRTVDRVRADEIRQRNPIRLRCCLRQHGVDPDAVLVEGQQVVRDDVRTVPIRRIEQDAEPLRMDEIVVVDDRQPRTARGLDAAVARAGRAKIRVEPDQPDTVVALAIGLDDGRAVVARAVVDDDQFEVADALSEHGLDRGCEIAAAPIVRHDDGDTGTGRPLRRTLHQETRSHANPG